MCLDLFQRRHKMRSTKHPRAILRVPSVALFESSRAQERPPAPPHTKSYTARPNLTALRLPCPALSLFRPDRLRQAAGLSSRGLIRRLALCRGAHHRSPSFSTSKSQAAGVCWRVVTPSRRPIIQVSVLPGRIPILLAKVKRGRSLIP